MASITLRKKCAVLFVLSISSAKIAAATNRGRAGFVRARSIKPSPTDGMNALAADFACTLRVRRCARYLGNRPRAMMRKILKQFIADESGATAIEYGLIAAGISLAIIAVVNGLGTKLNTKFTAINSSLK
jgi:pilus assembly protein Flp/PilA